MECRYLFELVFLLLSDKYPEVESLDYMVVILYDLHSYY